MDLVFRLDRYPKAIWALFLILVAGASTPGLSQPTSEESWLTRLRSADATERLAASFDVEPLPTTAEALQEMLAAALADPDPYVHRAGVAALGELEIDPKWAAPRLAVAIKDADEQVAAHAYVACGKLGRAVVAPLLAALGKATKQQIVESQDPDETFRAAWQIAAALLVATPGSFDEILDALEAALSRVPQTQAKAGTTDEVPPHWARPPYWTRPPEEIHVELLLTVIRQRNPTGEPCRRLLKILGPDSDRRVYCNPSAPTAPRARIAYVNRQALAEQIEKDLDDDDTEIRKEAGQKVYRVLDLLSTGRLEQLLDTDEEFTVAAAAGELARRGVAPEAAVEALAELLSPEMWEPKLLNALAAVAELDRNQALAVRDDVLALAGDDDVAWSVRVAAVSLLPRLFGPEREALDVLAAALRWGGDLQVQAASAFTVIEPSYAAAALVLEPFLDKGGEMARQAAVLITEAAGREPSPPTDLTRLLSHPDWRVGAAVVQSAPAGLIPPQAEEAVLLALREADPLTALRTAIALQTAIALAPRRPELLVQLLVDLPPGVRPFDRESYRALGALAASADPDLEARIGEELSFLLRMAPDAQNVWQRLAGVEILAPQLGAGEAAAIVLRPLLWGKDDLVRRSAKDALLGLAEKASALSAADFALQIDKLVHDVFSAQLHALRPRGAADVQSAEDLPDLRPWPPPSFSRWDVLPASLYRADGVTFADVLAWLRGALNAAGFGGSGLFGVPEGFALVSPLERMDESGASLSGEDRWIRGKLPLKGFDVDEYLRRLFLAPPGDFRLLVFVVTPKRNLAGGQGELDPDLASTGLPSGLGLPESLARRPIGEAWVHVLVYHFRKKLGRQDLLQPSTIAFDRHLEGSGLTRFLQSLR